MASTKKTKNKKSSHKKTSGEKTKKGSATKHETKSKKATSKKVEHVTKHESHNKKKESKTQVKEESQSKLVAIILVIILALGILVFAGYETYIYLNHNNSNTGNSNVNTHANLNNGAINTNKNTESNGLELVVIEDPDCSICNISGFYNALKTKLLPGLQLKEIPYNSEEGKKFVEKLGITRVPVFLFNDAITKTKLWSDPRFVSYLTNVTIDGKKYYMLDQRTAASIGMPVSLIGVKLQILNGTPIIGNPNAPITIYEFTDFQCPFCALAAGGRTQAGYNPPVPNIIKNYVDTGKAKLVVYNFPLDQIHPHARDAANAAMCANEQGKFEQYYDILYKNQDQWTADESKFIDYAKQLGMNVTEFKNCYDSKKYNSLIDEQKAYGIKLGITGTPAFIVGKYFIAGALPYEQFEKILNSLDKQ